MNKKLKSLLLLLSLLVHQTTQPFSWDWASDLYTRASTAVSSYLTFEQGTLDQIKGAGFMLGLGALVAGIFYLKNKHDRQEGFFEAGPRPKRMSPTSKDDSKGIIAKATYEIHGKEFEIQQLKVALQIGASCGYHAIKNAYGHATEYFSSYDNPLGNVDLIGNFIGNDGRWRRTILALEVSSELKNTLLKQFEYRDVAEDFAEAKFKGDTLSTTLNPARIRSKYVILLSEFLAYAIQNPDSYAEIDNDTFKATFAKFIAYNKSINIDDKDDYLILPSRECTTADAQALLWDHLSKEEVVGKYISLKSDLTLERSGESVNLKVNGKTVHSKKNGDWIGDDHVAFLCCKINKELGDNKLPIIVIQDIEDLNLTDSRAVPGEITHFVKLAKKQERYIQAFIVGNMSQRNLSSGHWIAVEFEKNEGKHTYTVMDSLNNYGIDSPLVQRLVGHIETRFHKLAG